MYRTTRALGAGEGLTIVATWPKGYIKPPDAWARLGFLARDGRPALIAIGGLVALTVYYFFIWTRVGRDPPGRIVVPQYEPPAGESPAALRYLCNMKYDDRTFAAGILGLAVKGCLSIDQRNAGLFGRSSEYTLQRETPTRAPALTPDESVLLERVFASGSHLELDDENHVTLQAAKSAHEKALRKQYTPRFFRINDRWHFLGVVVSLLLVLFAVVLPLVRGEFDLSWFASTTAGWASVGAVGVALLSNGIFGRLLKAPTVAGRAVMDHIEGYRLYLDVAEGDELKLAGAPPLTRELFENHLPAALALGVEQHWAERFATVFATQAASQSPSWYHGDRWDSSDVGRFSKSFGSSFRARSLRPRQRRVRARDRVAAVPPAAAAAVEVAAAGEPETHSARTKVKGRKLKARKDSPSSQPSPRRRGEGVLGGDRRFWLSTFILQPLTRGPVRRADASQLLYQLPSRLTRLFFAAHNLSASAPELPTSATPPSPPAVCIRPSCAMQRCMIAAFSLNRSASNVSVDFW